MQSFRRMPQVQGPVPAPGGHPTQQSAVASTPSFVIYSTRAESPPASRPTAAPPFRMTPAEANGDALDRLVRAVRSVPDRWRLSVAGRHRQSGRDHATGCRARAQLPAGTGFRCDNRAKRRLRVLKGKEVRLEDKQVDNINDDDNGQNLKHCFFPVSHLSNSSIRKVAPRIRQTKEFVNKESSGATNRDSTNRMGKSIRSSSLWSRTLNEPRAASS